MPFAWRWMLRGLLLGAPSLSLESAHAAISAESKRLPTIKQVAVMPVYWQGTFPEGHPFAPLRQHLDQVFSGIARASKRFTFTNDVITADLWATPEGRRELSDEYEIDGLLNLSITGQNDLMLWTVRLLSPGMQTYLSENERVPYSWFLAAEPSEIDARLQSLLYRMLNRYPIDVFVTSVQGRYVTLSSGSEQQIFEGDELSFYETTLKSQHPVDASWLNFEQKLLGKAKIVESKTQSSIALITSLSFENAIKLGDGAKVAAIATRRPFQQVKEDEQRYVPVAKDSPIVQAPGDWKKPLTPPPAPEPLPQPSKAAPKVADARQPEFPAGEANPQPIPLPPASEGEPSGFETGSDPQNFQELIAATFKEINLLAGIESLDFTGSGNLASKTPSWYINRLAAQGKQDFTPEWQGIFTTTLHLGSSKKGDYFGVGLQAEALYKIEAFNSTIPSLDRILAGGLLRVETIGVNGENFGGWDVAFVSPVVHLQGNQHLTELVQTIDYDISLRYFMQAMGSAGISGKKRDIGSGSAFEIETSAIARGRPQEFEWGAQFNYHSGAWNLSRGSIDKQNLSLGLLGRMRF